MTSLPFACLLDEVGRSASPMWVDPAAPAAQAVVNPTFFLTYPSAFGGAGGASGPPRAWVRDTCTGGLWPFTAAVATADTVTSLAMGPPPVDGDRNTWEALRKATLLVTTDELERRQRSGDAQVELASEHFSNVGWCELDNLVHPAHLANLAERYRLLIESGQRHIGDRQVANRYSWSNDPPSQFFHRQLAAYLGRIIGCRLHPTYSFVSSYRGGARLARHFDRPECEFTLSVVLDGTGCEPWPLCLETESGVARVDCRPGQAVLFRRPLLHYRDELAPGRTWTTLLLHYISASV